MAKLVAGYSSDEEDCYFSPIPSSYEDLFLRGSLPIDTNIVLICNGKVTDVIRNYLISALRLEKCCSVLGSSSERIFSSVWKCSESTGISVALLSIEEHLPEILIPSLIKSLAQLFHSSTLVLLGGIPLISLPAVDSTAAPGGKILTLQSSSFSRLVTGLTPRQINELGIGNVVSGIIAGIFCYAEAHSIAAIGCLTVCPHSSSITIESARALENALPLINNICGLDEGSLSNDVELLSIEMYRNLQKRDGYVIRTSNLYV